MSKNAVETQKRITVTRPRATTNQFHTSDGSVPNNSLTTGSISNILTRITRVSRYRHSAANLKYLIDDRGPRRLTSQFLGSKHHVRTIVKHIG